MAFIANHLKGKGTPQTGLQCFSFLPAKPSPFVNFRSILLTHIQKP